LRRAATFATIRGAYADAHALTQQSRTAYERIGDGGGIAEAIHNLAVIEHRTGDDAGAQRHYAEALALFRGSGNVRFELFSLLNLVLLALKADDFTTAADRLAEAGPLAEKIDDAGMRSYQIGLCGTLAFRRGRFDEAIGLFGQALAIKRRLGERFDIAELLDRIAEATLKRGDGDAARALSRESLQIALELDSHVLLIRSFETFAELALHDAEPGEAHLYFEHARALREQHGYKHTIRDLDALAADIALANNAHRAQSYPPPSWRETAERLAFTPAPP
jgi:tetratricopeptide (TPR) repeat protein